MNGPEIAAAAIPASLVISTGLAAAAIRSVTSRGGKVEFGFSLKFTPRPVPPEPKVTPPEPETASGGAA